MITNKLNINNRLYEVVSSHEHEPSKDSYSVTEILNSIRAILLHHRHYNEVNVDVVDLIPALFGSAVHKLLESDDEGSEEKLETKIGDTRFVGVIDLYHDGIIEDYKTCSATKVQKKDFDEHVKQCLMYAWLKYQVQNIRVNKIKINYLIKDWSKVKATSVPDYPQSALFVYETTITDMDLVSIEDYIKNKINSLKNAESLSDDELPECSDEERWYTGTKYATYKNKDDKRATKVYDSKEEAEASGLIVVERPGTYLKCDLYCNYRKFCSKYKS